MFNLEINPLWQYFIFTLHHCFSGNLWCSNAVWQLSDCGSIFSFCASSLRSFNFTKAFIGSNIILLYSASTILNTIQKLKIFWRFWNWSTFQPAVVHSGSSSRPMLTRSPTSWRWPTWMNSPQLQVASSASSSCTGKNLAPEHRPDKYFFQLLTKINCHFMPFWRIITGLEHNKALHFILRDSLLNW